MASCNDNCELELIRRVFLIRTATEPLHAIADMMMPCLQEDRKDKEACVVSVMQAWNLAKAKVDHKSKLRMCRLFHLAHVAAIKCDNLDASYKLAALEEMSRELDGR